MPTFNVLRAVPRRARLLPFLALLVALSPGLASAAAESSPAPAVAAGQSAVTPSADAADAAASLVPGFRTARFGMSQDEVKAAIATDFGIKPDAIAAGQNAAERTQLLSVIVPDLLQDGGSAQVSYVFGYKSKKLIQVGISWSKATDPAIDEQKLVADGDVLRSHFISDGYKADTIKTGLVLPNGLLLFRGEDGDGHATILILQGSFKSDAATKQQILTATSLALLYSQDPQRPDVFKIAPGQF